jgi:two-component system nitrate/nitrite response regulator NarL
MDPPAPEFIKVFVLAENQLYREAVAAFLASKCRLKVVGMSSPGVVPRRQLRELEPDIVLLDVATPESTSATLRAIVAGSRAKVVALGVTEVASEVIAYAEAGIAGYVPRDGSLADLLATIESVASDELPLPPKIAASLVRRVATLAAEQPATRGFQDLTARETEIIKLVDEGLSNKEIARHLYIELSTVKNHIHHILEKLGARRRAEAAAKFRGLGERWS